MLSPGLSTSVTISRSWERVARNSTLGAPAMSERDPAPHDHSHDEHDHSHGPPAPPAGGASALSHSDHDDHDHDDHDHDDHDHAHGDHDHAHASGLRGFLGELFHSHSHAGSRTDPALESSERGIWALKISLAG